MSNSTSSHPPPNRPDATETSGQSARQPSSSSQLSSLKIRLQNSLRQYPDFPSPGILFEDILPLFSDPTLHQALIDALELHIKTKYPPGQRPNIIVGLEARGFLFGPSLALRLGAGFVPVRKPGKLPGPTETESYQKEYGQDFFQIQADAVKPGQLVLIVDDIIATGMVMSRSPGFPANRFERWLRCSSWITGQETGWYTAGLRFHTRTRLPQRP